MAFSLKNIGTSYSNLGLSRSNNTMVVPLTTSFASNISLSGKFTPSYVWNNSWTTSWPLRAPGSTDTFTSNFRSIVWSPDLGLYVAVAGSGSRMAYSKDGLTWKVPSGILSIVWTGVTWSSARDLFVIVGASSTEPRTLMASSNGINWTACYNPTSTDLRAIAWSPQKGIFVAVGSPNSTKSTATYTDAGGDVTSYVNSRVLTSTDGLTWTPSNTAVDGSWYGLCWSPQLSLFVAVGQTTVGGSTRAMKSSDGVTWTQCNATPTNAWNSVCWSPELGRFVAVASSGTNRVMISTDGNTFVSASTTPAAWSWYSVVWASELSLFIAAGNGGVMTSPTGDVWTVQLQPSTFKSLVCVNWNPELSQIVALGNTDTLTDPATGATSTASLPWISPVLTVPPRVHGMTISVPSISSLYGLGNYLLPGQMVNVVSWHAGLGIGGSLFSWDANRSKADHNGGTVFSVTVPPLSAQTGLTFNDRLLAYRTKQGETDSTGVGCFVRVPEPDNVVRPEWFGAVADGKIDDSAAIQAAVQLYADRGFVLSFGPYTYRTSSEISFSNATFSCEESYVVQGVRSLTKIAPDDFGSSSAVFRCRSGMPCTFRDITIAPSDYADVSKNHPMGIYVPNGSYLAMNCVRVSGLGNTPLWIQRGFNCDLHTIDLQNCGYQPIHKSVKSSTTLTVVGGSKQIVATDDVFDQGDVGKEIIIVVQYISGTYLSNSSMLAKIESVQDARNATLDTPSIGDASGRQFSFCAVRGDISNSGSNLAMRSNNVFDANDVGRMIYIKDADDDGSVHVTKILSVVDGSNCVLQEPAPLPGGNLSNTRVYFTPQIYFGGYGQRDTAVNDVVVSSLLIEGFRGPGIFAKSGTHLWFNNVKTHGLPWVSQLTYNDNGRTCESCIIDDMRRVSICSWEHEFCNAEVGGGPVTLVGNSPQMYINNFTMGGPLFNAALFDFNYVNETIASLQLGNIFVPTDHSLYSPGVVKTSGSNPRLTCANLRGYSDEVERVGGLLPMQAGALRAVTPVTVSNGSQMSFKPASLAGLVSVATETSHAHAGIVSYRLVGGANDSASLLYGGSNLSSTTGTAGKLNVACSNGLLYVENLTGASQRVHLSVLG